MPADKTAMTSLASCYDCQRQWQDHARRADNNYMCFKNILKRVKASEHHSEIVKEHTLGPPDLSYLIKEVRSIPMTGGTDINRSSTLDVPTTFSWNGGVYVHRPGCTSRDCSGWNARDYPSGNPPGNQGTFGSDQKWMCRSSNDQAVQESLIPKGQQSSSLSQAGSPAGLFEQIVFDGLQDNKYTVLHNWRPSHMTELPVQSIHVYGRYYQHSSS